MCFIKYSFTRFILLYKLATDTVEPGIRKPGQLSFRAPRYRSERVTTPKLPTAHEVFLRVLGVIDTFRAALCFQYRAARCCEAL